MNKLSFWLVWLFAITVQAIYAQTGNTTAPHDHRTCGMEHFIQELKQEDEAAYETARRAYNQFIETAVAQKNNERSTNNLDCPNGITVIPIAFHIFHESGAAIGTQHNFSLTDLQGVIAQLNTDYSAYNGDKSILPEDFQLVDAGHTCIQFCIGKIDRIDLSTCPSWAIGANHHALNGCLPGGSGPGSANDPHKYLNIYTTELGNGLGIASCIPPFFGNCNNEADGVTVDWDHFIIDWAGSAPYNKGRTLTHEIGHWMGLPHVNGDINGGGCSGDDGFEDTHLQSGQRFYHCGESIPVSCGTQDNVFNYMDYSNDCALVTFTSEQKAAMQAVLASERASLANSYANGNYDNNLYNMNCIIANPSNHISIDLNCSGEVNLLNYIKAWYPSAYNTAYPSAGLSRFYWLEGGLNGIFTSNYFEDADLDIIHSGACYGDVLNYTLVMDCWNPSTNTYTPPVSAGTVSLNITECETCSFPIAAFSPNENLTLCPDNAFIQFSDLSMGVPSDWHWTFSGAGTTSSFSYDQNPLVQVTSSGTLIATLNVSNAYGSNQITQTFQVNMLPASSASCNVCNYTLEMWDSWGDGWTGLKLNVTIGDNTTTYTGPAIGQLDLQILEIQEGDVVSITADDTAESYLNETAWRLLDANGTVVLSDGTAYGYGPNQNGFVAPQSGVAYNYVGTCAAPSCFDGLQNGNETDVDCGGSCGLCACTNVSISITLDDYPVETSWDLKDVNGNMILSGDDYIGMDFETITTSMCLDFGCYTFNIYDSFGDGMCCDEGNGIFTLTDTDNNIILGTGGDFGDEANINFCLEPNGANQGSSPSCPTTVQIINPIDLNTYQSSNSIISNTHITAGASVNYYSNTITLEAGFTIDAGAEFSAEILPCISLTGTDNQ